MELEGLWGIATIVGPIVLLVLFVYVIMRNRSSQRAARTSPRPRRDANYQAEDARRARD